MQVKKNALLPVKKFADLTLTTRKTLHFYDKIGILAPVLRGENNYRYYSPLQMSFINMIRIFQAGGMSLSEVKKLSEQRSPEYMDKVLESQLRQSSAVIESEVRVQKLLHTLQAAIRSALNIDEQTITIQSIPEIPIVLGELNDYSGGQSPFDALSVFYNTISKKFPQLDLNYPVWAMYEKDNIEKSTFGFPDRFYFFNPEGQDSIPEAQYAIGYARGSYGMSDNLFKRIFNYIDINNFEICGNAYEEYPLNEVCIVNNMQYLVRVMIAVRKK